MAKASRKHSAKKSRVRAKTVRGGRGPKSSTSQPTSRAIRDKYKGWLIERLLENEKLAADFHNDFVKSRGKNPLNSRVRARIRTTLNAYAKRIDRNRLAIRSTPDEFRAFLAEQEAARIGVTWAEEIRDIAGALDAMHEAVERERSRAAAPMNERETREFSRNVEKLDLSMNSLRDFCKNLRLRIPLSREGAARADLLELNNACNELCKEIDLFYRQVGARRATSSVERARAIQAAAEQYRANLGSIDAKVTELLNARRRHENEELKSLVQELQSELGGHALRIDMVLYTDALRFGLPWEADQNALKIKEVVAEILQTINRSRGTLGLSKSDEHARCDTLSEDAIRDYENLSDNVKEHKQFRVIVDCLLMLLDTRGPNATLARKQLQQTVVMLAGHRKVAGLGATSLWGKLDRLAGLHLVRKIPAVKSKSNQNAADEYRLSIPSQIKYASHAAAVRAEFEHIAALSPAAKPLD